MLRVGLTGNIGSGKTVTAKVFSSLGIPVFHADHEARTLLNDDRIKNKIRLIFGDHVFSPSGEIIRPVLADIVFTNPSLLEKLNSIIHPEVRNNYRQWCLQHRDSAYTLYEAAILFESGHYKEMDKIICVIASEKLRISRVMERDGLSRQEVESRITNQWPEEKKVDLADFIIKNDESDSVILQVMEIHKKLISKYGK